MKKLLIFLFILSPFTFVSAAPTFTFIVLQGGTGFSSTSPNSLLATGATATSTLVATSSPTVNSITATSTTQASVLPLLSLSTTTTGCLATSALVVYSTGTDCDATITGGTTGMLTSWWRQTQFVVTFFLMTEVWITKCLYENEPTSFLHAQNPRQSCIAGESIVNY